jgi:hypothetical protein
MKRVFLYLFSIFFFSVGIGKAQCLCPPTGYNSFGDSITAGFEINPVTFAYPYLVAYDRNLSLTNFGTNGMAAADMGDIEIYPNINPTNSSTNPIYTMMIGTNDADVKGAGSYETVYNLVQQAEISWLGVAQNYKTFGQSASAVTTGTWANDNNYLSGVDLKSTTNGPTLSLPITTAGGNIYLWYRIMDGNGGVFTYKLDGGSTTSVNCFTSPAISTPLGNTHGVGIVRITGVSAGTHTVLLTVTSSTNAGNIVSVRGIGTPPPNLNDPAPKVFVGGVIKQLNDAKSSDTAAYNADALANANLFNSDGLQVWPVDVRVYVNSTTDMGSQLHPNSTGQRHLADAFEHTMSMHS